MENPLLNFLNEPIEPHFNEPPMLEKKPHCPNAFLWREQEYAIVAVLSEWVDNRRRGRMSRNMQDEHARRAAVVGSWGVGRYYFRVRTHTGQIFDIYYDRAPASAGDRKGHWFIFGERKP